MLTNGKDCQIQIANSCQILYYSPTIIHPVKRTLQRMAVTGHKGRFTDNISNKIHLQCSQGKLMHIGRSSQEEAYVSLHGSSAVNTLQKTYNRQAATTERYKSLFWEWERTGRQGLSDCSLDCDAQKWNYDLSVHTHSRQIKMRQFNLKLGPDAFPRSKQVSGAADEWK